MATVSEPDLWSSSHSGADLLHKACGRILRRLHAARGTPSGSEPVRPSGGATCGGSGEPRGTERPSVAVGAREPAPDRHVRSSTACGQEIVGDRPLDHYR